MPHPHHQHHTSKKSPIHRIPPKTSQTSSNSHAVNTSPVQFHGFEGKPGSEWEVGLKSDEFIPPTGKVSPPRATPRAQAGVGSPGSKTRRMSPTKTTMSTSTSTSASSVGVDKVVKNTVVEDENALLPPGLLSSRCDTCPQPLIPPKSHQKKQIKTNMIIKILPTSYDTSIPTSISPLLVRHTKVHVNDEDTHYVLQDCSPFYKTLDLIGEARKLRFSQVDGDTYPMFDGLFICSSCSEGSSKSTSTKKVVSKNEDSLLNLPISKLIEDFEAWDDYSDSYKHTLIVLTFTQDKPEDENEDEQRKPRLPPNIIRSSEYRFQRPPPVQPPTVTDLGVELFGMNSSLLLTCAESYSVNSGEVDVDEVRFVLYPLKANANTSYIEFEEVVETFSPFHPPSSTSPPQANTLQRGRDNQQQLPVQPIIIEVEQVGDKGRKCGFDCVII